MEDVAQIPRVRRELEGLAVELVEQRATAADLDLLDQLIGQMREAANEENLPSFYRSDLEFTARCGGFPAIASC